VNLSGWRKPALLVGAFAWIELASRVGLPGVDSVALFQFFKESGGSGGLLGLYSFLAGGGPFRASVLALGVVPYLSARILMRLSREVSTTAAAWSDDERRIRTRWITGVLATIQSFGFATFLQRTPGVVPNPGLGFTASAVVLLTASSLVAMWVAEKLTDADTDSDLPELSALPEHLAAAPALPAPALPVSPPLHQHPSSGAETLRTPR
jgi:preprotein translocase subunit SecY